MYTFWYNDVMFFKRFRNTMIRRSQVIFFLQRACNAEQSCLEQAIQQRKSRLAENWIRLPILFGRSIEFPAII